jgi:ubiquinone/menaquinone biosynthesis C-methylase UbiE
MRTYQDQLKQDYNRIWNTFLDKRDYYKPIRSHQINRQAYYEIIKKYISRFNSPLVLELGCGTGIDINIVCEKNKNIQPYASDILTKSIRIGSSVAHIFKNQIRFFVSNTLNLPFKDGEFDIVFSQGLIEHFKNPLAVIKEHTRVLTEGGFLIINVPQKFTGYTLMKKKKMKKNNWELGWETEFSYNDLKKLGNQLGIKEVGVSGYQYWQSWGEPAFVLKDLVDKIFRRMPIVRFKMFALIQKKYNVFWQKLEMKWGHYFLQNIIIVFEK